MKIPVKVVNTIVLAFWLWAACAAHAHVGSPTVFFQGLAGSFPVRVTIQPPGVVPGLAQIHIVVSSGDATRVTVRPVRWDVGVKGSPAPDTAVLVPGETNMFTAQLWLMASGAYSVFVEVSGPGGEGTAIVPLNSIATQRLVMTPGLSLIFLIVGTFVVVLLISVVGAAIREGRLTPGQEISPLRRRRGWYARGITAAVIGTSLVLGNAWWNSVDRDYRNNRLYRPQSVQTELDLDAAGHRELVLRFSPKSPIDATPLIPDHGRLMHLFLIRDPDGDVFAHLHPNRKREDNPDENVFTARLPALPAGQYKLYADITHESGLTQTLTNMLSIPSPVAGPGADEPLAETDDAVLLSPPSDSSTLTLPGGLRLDRAFPEALQANQETNLLFHLTTESGADAPLESYLGMYGHLIIENSDGTVFNHLHPLGSVSMVSQRLFAEREKAGYLANKPLDQFCTAALPELSFPYAFPKPGEYRLWLQTKVAGRILTGAYSLSVK
ncbi:MAG TPA: hypothetical protein VMR33_08945 [Candidatus Baltobacteraceae bacterium]|jgi:hypothetical protein|nr:hypothetical protein [Candidatus Baltobacteraceae bacterium]